MTDTAPEPHPRWLDRKAAAGYLCCHPATVDRLADAGHITRHKLGSLSRYDPAELDNAVRRGAVAPTGRTAAYALAAVAARIPRDRSLIPVRRVLDIIAAVTAEVGAEQPTRTPTTTGATR
jgi:hypothetical protein